MAEDIVIRYRAEVDDLLRKLDQISDAQKEVIEGEIKANNATKQAATTQAVAAQKRAQLLELEKKKLAELQKAQKLAFDPKQIDQYNRKISESQKNIDLLKGKVGGLKSVGASVFSSIAAGAAAAFSASAIINFSKQAVDAFARIETGRLVFQNLVGDAEIANDLFQRLTDFSVKTPFTPEQVQDSARALLQFGVSVDDLLPTIKILGDVSAGTGKDLRELSVIFGQIKSTGRLLGQDLLQLINAGFNPLQVISEKTGKSVATLKKEMEKGNITFEQVAEAFKIATSEGGKFFNLTEKLATTTAGQLSTIQGEVEQLSASIGESLAPSFIKFQRAVLQAVQSLITYGNVQKQVINQQERIGRDVAEKVVADLKAQGVENERLIPIIQKLADERQREADQLELNRQLRVRKQELSRKESQDIEAEITRNRSLAESYRAQIELILRQADAQSKVTDEAKKLSDVRIAGSDKEVQQIKTLTAEYRDLLKLFQLTPEQRQLIDLNVSSENIDDFKQKVAEIVAQNPLEIPVTLELPPDRVVQEAGEKLGGSLVDSILKRYAEEIATTQQLLGELTNLYANFTNAQIADINREKDARIAALNEALEVNQQNLELRRISEREALRNEQVLLNEKVKAEEQAAKKEREIKRRQAIADKAAALVNIAIQTAQNIVKAAGNPALIALYAALGASQAAVVVSQPIPYKKGSKSTEGGLSRVGEDGDEILYIPKGSKVLPNKQTNRYGEVLDAMFDNRFDEYINRRYIAPALMKEKQRREVNQQKSFADNIVQSAMINPQTGLTYYDMEQIRKKGTILRDVSPEVSDAIGRAVARAFSKDPYR